MYAYLADTFRFQPERQVPATTVFAWLKRKLEALRAARRVLYLRHLDRETLADVGVDAAILGDVRQSSASFDPHAVAASIFAGSSRRPIP